MIEAASVAMADQLQVPGPGGKRSSHRVPPTFRGKSSDGGVVGGNVVPFEIVG